MTPSSFEPAAPRARETGLLGLGAPPSVSATRSSRVAQLAGTLLACAVLGFVGYFGMRAGWSTSGLYSLFTDHGQPEAAWCEDHNVPEADCIECRPDLLAKMDFGWCSAHGVHNCPLHNPDVVQTKGAPTVTAQRIEQAAQALGSMERTENNSRCMLYKTRVQFASREAMEKAGVDVALVEEHPVVEGIEASGELGYDETRLAHISSRVEGNAVAVLKQVGDPVRRGDVLALVDAAQVGQAKAKFLQALVQRIQKRVTVERLRKLPGAVPGQQVVDAESAFRLAEVELVSAEQMLQNLGLPIHSDEFEALSERGIADRMRYLGVPDEASRLLDQGALSGNLLPVRSPLDGVVVERDVVPGEVVGPQKPMFEIANPTSLWLMLNVPQEDSRHLKPGQEVLFRPDNKGSEVRGTLNWLSTTIDDATRTVRVRAEVPNADGQLRANLFGKGTIVLRREAAAIVVPNEAVHWDGSCHVVFVRDKLFFNKARPKFFYVRTVRLGVRTDTDSEVIVGLLPGEIVATRGSGALLAQVLKSNLGAGCCGND